MKAEYSPERDSAVRSAKPQLLNSDHATGGKFGSSKPLSALREAELDAKLSLSRSWKIGKSS